MSSPSPSYAQAAASSREPHVGDRAEEADREMSSVNLGGAAKGYSGSDVYMREKGIDTDFPGGRYLGPLQRPKHTETDAFDSRRSRLERSVFSWSVGAGAAGLLVVASIFLAIGIGSGVSNIVGAAQISSVFGIILSVLSLLIDISSHGLAFLAGVCGVGAFVCGVRTLPRAERDAGADSREVLKQSKYRQQWADAYTGLLSLTILTYAVLTSSRWIPLLWNLFAAAASGAQGLDLWGHAVSLLFGLASLATVLGVVALFWSMALLNSNNARTDLWSLRNLPLLSTPGGREMYSVSASTPRGPNASGSALGASKEQQMSSDSGAAYA